MQIQPAVLHLLLTVHSYILEDDQQGGLHSTMVKEPGSLHPTHTQEAMIDTTQSVPIGFPPEGENMEAAEVGHSMLSSDLGAYLQSCDFSGKCRFPSQNVISSWDQCRPHTDLNFSLHFLCKSQPFISFRPNAYWCWIWYMHVPCHKFTTYWYYMD